MDPSLMVAVVETYNALVVYLPDSVKYYLSLIFEWAPRIVLIASAIAAITPTPKDNLVLAFLYKYLVDVPALNVFKAKQK